LVSYDANVLVVIRSESTSKSHFPPSAKQVHASFDDVDALAAAFKEHGTEVVVSTVGSFGILSQITIADAAKKAGVKLFVPSEYGFATTGVTEEGVLGNKQRVAEHLAALGLPSTRIFVRIAFSAALRPDSAPLLDADD
jgi:hypothetical protein